MKINDKLNTVLTESQMKELLNKSRLYGSPFADVYAFALYTGMRSGELYALRWENVCLEQQMIFVKQSWCSKQGFKTTKSGDDRSVFICNPLLSIIKELKLKDGDSEFVLPRIQKWTRGEQARELRKFLIGIGLPPIRFHDLRASWATLMLAKGVPPAKLMISGGWKDMKTMMHYVRRAGIDVKGITDCLDLHDSQIEGKLLEMHLD